MNYELRIKKNILYLFCALLFCAGLALPFGANAAEMFFVGSDKKPAVGELFKADLFINTEKENINAVAGKIVFPADSLELKEARDGNSVVNLWVDRPMLKDSGQIMFSGITPGGYKGANGLLFSLIFHVLKSGPVSIKVAEGQALLNDGKGTAAKLSSSALDLQIAAKSDGEQADYAIIDKTPPESFVPEIARDNDIKGGKWFVVFATQDKESGIDHYEVAEDKSDYVKEYQQLRWQKTESPYVLKDQSLASYVYVKAVDNENNERVAALSPRHPRQWYQNFLFWGIMLLTFVYLLYRRKICVRKKTT